MVCGGGLRNRHYAEALYADPFIFGAHLPVPRRLWTLRVCVRMWGGWGCLSEPEYTPPLTLRMTKPAPPHD